MVTVSLTREENKDMDIRMENINDSLKVILNGRIDTTTSPALEQELKSGMQQFSELILDFAGVEYISSAGLRVLLSAHKFMSKKGGLKLINVSDDISEILEVTGFNDILNIE